jgi:hypothetical protein
MRIINNAVIIIIHIIINYGKEAQEDRYYGTVSCCASKNGFGGI